MCIMWYNDHIYNIMTTLEFVLHICAHAPFIFSEQTAYQSDQISCLLCCCYDALCGFLGVTRWKLVGYLSYVKRVLPDVFITSLFT